MFFGFSGFPKCELFVQSSLNAKELQRRPKVFNAYLKACGNEKKIAVEALKWGSLPEVTIHSGGLITSNGSRSCGVNRKAHFVNSPTSIEIADFRFTSLEHCVNAKDFANAKLRLENTLLHETVHWVREQAGLTDMDWDFPDSEEPGWQFEIWAYGQRACTQFDIDDSKASIF